MGRPGADHDLGKKQFVRVYNLHEARPELRPLFFSERLAKAAHELAGMSGGIRHYQNQAFFKEREDGATLYHADNLACPLDTHNQCVTLPPLPTHTQKACVPAMVWGFLT